MFENCCNYSKDAQKIADKLATMTIEEKEELLRKINKQLEIKNLKNKGATQYEND